MLAVDYDYPAVSLAKRNAGTPGRLEDLNGCEVSRFRALSELEASDFPDDTLGSVEELGHFRMFRDVTLPEWDDMANVNRDVTRDVVIETTSDGFQLFVTMGAETVWNDAVSLYARFSHTGTIELCDCCVSWFVNRDASGCTRTVIGEDGTGAPVPLPIVDGDGRVTDEHPRGLCGSAWFGPDYVVCDPAGEEARTAFAHSSCDGCGTYLAGARTVCHFDEL